MLFSSNIFIFIFLPMVLFVYYALLKNSRPAQNVFLLMSSLFFYAWGEPRFVLIMMLSIAVNWFAGLLVDRFRSDRTKVRAVIFADVLFNLTILFIFKYLTFTLTNLQMLGLNSIIVPVIELPIGISFFTFQAMSYVIDVYRNQGDVQKNILNVGLYISFFPQLIAGPIVRYSTVAKEIKDRRETVEDFSEGVVRFIIGLSKKVIIANNMALVADYAFSTPGDNSILLAWLGAAAYTFQIYFDFGGYSDMAIGLGRMFGFHFLENFDYPYISLSITEFWRRWHISLGSWFRDYLYIPLGGNRTKTHARHVFNIFIVWLCTGIWHGANWTFILWGLMYFALLIFEKYSGYDVNDKEGKHHVIKHIYTLFFVISGWVIFRAENLSVAAAYYGDMFDPRNTLISAGFTEYFRQYGWLFIAAAVISTPLIKKLKMKSGDGNIAGIAGAVVLAILMLFSISFIVKNSYNPFIYFNF